MGYDDILFLIFYDGIFLTFLLKSGVFLSFSEEYGGKWEKKYFWCDLFLKNENFTLLNSTNRVAKQALMACPIQWYDIEIIWTDLIYEKCS